jgi:hypothetical protein
MAAPLPANLETRRDQIFPTLSAADIERLQRFGSVLSYPAGTVLVKAGSPSPGLQVIHSGTAMVQSHDKHLGGREILEHRAGSVVGVSRLTIECHCPLPFSLPPIRGEPAVRRLAHTCTRAVAMRHA